MQVLRFSDAVKWCYIGGKTNLEIEFLIGTPEVKTSVAS
jgi:hypothetical protein